MCKEQPSVHISNGSPSLVKTATEPRRVMHNTRRLSLVQAMSAIHQDLKIEMDVGVRELIIILNAILSLVSLLAAAVTQRLVHKTQNQEVWIQASLSTVFCWDRLLSQYLFLPRSLINGYWQSVKETWSAKNQLAPSCGGY